MGVKNTRPAVAIVTTVISLTAAFATGTATALPVSVPGHLTPDSGFLILAQGGPSGGGTGGGGGGGGGYGGEESDENERSANERRGRGGSASPPLVTAVQPANSVSTNAIVSQVNEIRRVCQGAGDEYRVDCFATQFRDLSARLPARGDYSAARQALQQASVELGRIARANRDRSKPRIRVRVNQVGGAPTVSAPITAVRASSVDQANLQAAASVEKLQATLLRSVPDNDPRDVHYQRIAASFNSTAVLLRS